LHRRLDIAAAVATLVGLALCAAPGAAFVHLPAGFVDDTLLTGLKQPNSMAFLPDGRLLFTEQRNGYVRLFANGHIAATDPVLVVPNVTALDYERGLQGIAVDPGWPARPYIYLYYDHFGDFIRLVRYTASGDLSDPGGENLALANPLILMDDIPDDNPIHNSGCLRFGPGGYLFVSVGDDGDFCGARDSTSLKGAILRLDVSRLPAGPGGPVPRALLIPPGNPFWSPDSNARLVWAYGFRNPWRYGIDQNTGAIYSADVGGNTQEEIDEVLPGDFCGWPWREGLAVLLRPSCGEPGGSGSNQFKDPIVAMPRGPDLMAFLCAGMYRPVPGGSNNWPSAYYGFYGDVFYGEYYSGFLRRLKRQAGVWSAANPVYGQPNTNDWATGLISAVDFQVGPDGSLWWMAQFDSVFNPTTGSLQRIRYTGVVVGVANEGVYPRALIGAPNPFARATELSFRLPAREAVRLEFFDVGGRRVRRLLDGEAPAGESRIAWDGRDDQGAPVAPGLYLARLERANRAAQSVRLLRLK